MGRKEQADLPAVSDEGSQVQARRERLGMGIKELAAEAGVSRDTLSDLESGTKDYRQTTLGKVLRALARIEQEAGLDTPLPPPSGEPHLVRFEVKGVYGAEALVVEGPVEDIAELEAAVDRIMRRVQARDDRDERG